MNDPVFLAFKNIVALQERWTRAQLVELYDELERLFTAGCDAAPPILELEKPEQLRPPLMPR